MIPSSVSVNRRVAMDLSSGQHGIPDRMTIDTNGNLWIAFYQGGKVAQVNPERGTYKLNTTADEMMVQ